MTVAERLIRFITGMIRKIITYEYHVIIQDTEHDMAHTYSAPYKGSRPCWRGFFRFGGWNGSTYR